MENGWNRKQINGWFEKLLKFFLDKFLDIKYLLTRLNYI